MKNLSITPVWAIIITLAVACAPTDKKAELEKLISEREQLNAKIEELKAAIEADGEPALAAVDSSKYKMVSVEALQPTTFNHFVQIQGKVDTDNNIIVSCETQGGMIKNVRVKRGDRVKKGQILAELDNVMIRKGIEELKTSLDLAVTLFEKQEKLWKENVGTEVQYLQAKSTKESLESRMAQLQDQLKKTRITAPMDGIIDEVFRKEGEIIAMGMPAFRVVNGSDFKVVGELAEAYISKINPGDEVEIYFPDIKKTLKEKINVVGSTINPVNRTFVVEAKISKNSPDIKPNLVAYMKIKDFSKANALVVPINTVQTSRIGQYVFVAQGSIVVKKNVVVTETYGNTALVDSGLAVGDKIITFGYNDLTEGQNIKY